MSQDESSDRDSEAGQTRSACDGEIDWGLHLEPGVILGDRYRIRSLLGSGGMGEVWQADDLKLRVEVALKGIRPEFLADERRRESLRTEVRAAREVVSPNVCRIFDLIEIDGYELVSMEFVDGETLLEVLEDRGPLGLKEAQDTASQFLAGLEAIHEAGLVHRDVKPENIMITRTGRVVLMDLGLARQETEGAGSVAGTPAYMAPEQATGQKVDACSDVYAAGVVLAEMVCPEGIKTIESRHSVWDGIREEPARVPDTPWAPVLMKAVSKDREGRYATAHTLTRALEDVTLRVEGAEDLRPYPGLDSFTEADAGYFFGRETEIERMWRKLVGPPRLLGLVGPSGAGKTSFIRAGVIPNAGSDWAVVKCTPGNAAFRSLRLELASELAGDVEAIRDLVEVDDLDSVVSAVSRWRRRHDRALLVVDQFEELFTLNTADAQARFAELLGRLVLEADVFVLLSMRDDFLFRCHEFEALNPVVTDLTLLGPPTGAALRRSLVQPAMKCGYRFEDDELVDEMVAEVEGERGALPLLAFAAARLWEKRDRDSGLLTRQAYHDIGGVGGALARHAEATIDRIGADRIAVVRDLFRNLVTAEGTRAVREWTDLVSIFSDSQGESPEEVLRLLIDARLLTSYEVRAEGEEPTRRIEIIHESLLFNWPRLGGWQTQDADSARLRDELRQAARSWDEHDRHDDRLWTGAAFREYQLWRERYSGGLTEVEEAFSQAMNALAGRSRRQRRAAVAAVLLMAVLVTASTTALWRRSVLEAHRAEAATLVSLGQLELESYPTASVAHAIASLEQADTVAARKLALEALWKGPPALVATEDFAWHCRFGPDGGWLVQTEVVQKARAKSLLSTVRLDGVREYPENAHCDTTHLFLSREVTDSGHFLSIAMCADSTWQVVPWSMPKGRHLAVLRSDRRVVWADDADRNRLVFVVVEGDRPVIEAVGYDGSVKRLGTPEVPYSDLQEWDRNTWFDRKNGRWLAALVEDEVLVFEIGDESISEPRRSGPVGRGAHGDGGDILTLYGVGRWIAAFLEAEALIFEIRDDGISEPRRLRPFDGRSSGFDIDPLGRFVVASDADGRIRLWSLSDTSPPLIFQGPPKFPRLFFSDDGSHLTTNAEQDGQLVEWLWSLSGDPPRFLRHIAIGAPGWGRWKWDSDHRQIARWGPDKTVRVWSLEEPANAEPLVLLRGNNEQYDDLSFSPRGTWLATADASGLALWSLERRCPVVIREHESEIGGLAFAPDGSWVASSSSDGTVRLWPLDGNPPPLGRILMEIDRQAVGIAVSPNGEHILTSTFGEGTWMLSPDGGETRVLEGVNEGYAAAFSSDGRFAAAAAGIMGVEERRIVIWDVSSGEKLHVFEVGEMVRLGLHFISDGHLLSASESGLLKWNMETEEQELLYAGDIVNFAANDDGERVLMVVGGESSLRGRVVLLDLETDTVTRLDQFGDDVMYVALDKTGRIAAAGDRDGEVRVGLVSGGQAHLFVGHEGSIWSVAIDPLGRWVASGSDDHTLRLWPMPDLDEPPLHTLPRNELIAKLKTLTNLRVVRDGESPTGWRLEIGPFPGWETVPSW